MFIHSGNKTQSLSFMLYIYFFYVTTEMALVVRYTLSVVAENKYEMSAMDKGGTIKSEPTERSANSQPKYLSAN